MHRIKGKKVEAGKGQHIQKVTSSALILRGHQVVWLFGHKQRTYLLPQSLFQDTNDITTQVVGEVEHSMRRRTIKEHPGREEKTLLIPDLF